MKNKKLYQDLKDYRLNNHQEDLSAVNKLTKDTGYPSLSFTWGETPYKTYRSVIQEVDNHFKRFVVGGCSIGWMNFYWNEKNPSKQTVGFDLHEGRVAYANFLIKKHDISNIDIYKKDILNFEFNKGDLVWLNNLMFPKDVNKKLLDKLVKLDLTIISYTKIPGPNVTNINLPVSWSSEQNFYIRHE